MSFSNPVAVSEDEDIEANSMGLAPADLDGNELSTSLLNRNEAQCSTNSGYAFKTVDTILTGILLLFFMISLFIVSAIIPIKCNTGISCPMKPLSLLLYLHCLFWGISLICDQHIQYHHIKVRRRGYLEFYNETRTLSQLPFWTVSTWSTLLLTTATILHDHCKTETTCGETVRLTKTEYVTIIIGLEAVILTGTLTVYMPHFWLLVICHMVPNPDTLNVMISNGHVWNFNTLKSAPDVLREDIMSSTLDFGSNSVGQFDEEIYERQADMIHYYKEHNAMLRKTVMELNRQLTGTSPSSS